MRRYVEFFTYDQTTGIYANPKGVPGTRPLSAIGTTEDARKEAEDVLSKRPASHAIRGYRILEGESLIEATPATPIRPFSKL